MRILSTGELLWDLVDGKQFLGGAPLNFSVSSQRLGNFAALVTGVGQDALGQQALSEMQSLGLNTDFVQVVRDAPTGTARVTVDPSGNAAFSIPRPAAFDLLRVGSFLMERYEQARPDWLYFGTLANAEPGNENFLNQLVQRLRPVKRFYDVNLRDGHWNLALVERLSKMATVIKLNDQEAKCLFEAKFAGDPYSVEQFCSVWRKKFGPEFICITMGSAGCAIFSDAGLQMYPGYSVDVFDTIGAGDAFAAALLYGLHLGWPTERIAQFANALGALIASKAGATPAWTLEECHCLMQSSPV